MDSNLTFKDLISMARKSLAALEVENKETVRRIIITREPFKQNWIEMDKMEKEMIQKEKSTLETLIAKDMAYREIAIREENGSNTN